MSAIHRTRSAASSTESGEPDITIQTFRLAGVKRIEALADHFTLLNRVSIYIGLFLVAFAYGLDNNLRNMYMNFATSDLGNHTLIGTVNVVRSIMGAVAQPAAARIADVFGRFELILVSIFFYITGTVLEATAQNIAILAAGSVLYQIGFTGIVLLVEVVVADTTTLRSRLMFMYIPSLPFLAHLGISGAVVRKVELPFWRWGIGMWAIIYPVSCITLLVTLWWSTLKAKRAGSLKKIKTPFQQHGGMKLVKVLFWQLDVVGCILMMLSLGCMLVPLTLSDAKYRADGTDLWAQPTTLVLLSFGLISIPLFILWELRASHPILPFHLITERAVWGALGIAITFNFAYYLQYDYLLTILIVSVDETYEAATRISNIYPFVSTFSGIFTGLIVFKVRYLKPFIFLGTVLWTFAFGLMIHFNGGKSQSTHRAIIFSQVLLGIGGGCFPYPALTSIQAAVKHEHLAVITSLYLSIYAIGSALGYCISAAIWTQVLPERLNRSLGTSIATLWYEQPVFRNTLFPVGTFERDRVIEAMKEVQRLICIAGVSVCILLVLFAVTLRNPRLPDKQSRVVEEDEEMDLVELAPEREQEVRRRFA